MTTQPAHNGWHSGGTGKIGDFYGCLLGFQIRGLLPTGHLMPDVGNPDGVGTLPRPNSETPGGPQAFIRVDCVETATMKAWDLGAEVLKDVTELPDSGWYSVIRDPAGFKVGLFQPLSDSGERRMSL